MTEDGGGRGRTRIGSEEVESLSVSEEDGCLYESLSRDDG